MPEAEDPNSIEAFDYKTLMQPDATPADPPAPIEAPSETPVPAAADDAESETTEEPEGEKKVGEEAEKPAPGTPNKELQKLTQKMSSIDDRLEKLMEIKAETGKLTAAQTEKVEALKEERDEVAELLKEEHQIDPFSDLRTIAKRTMDSEKKTNDRIAKLEEDLARERAERSWDRETTKFPGLDVRTIWNKAYEDAAKQIGQETEGIDITPESMTKLCHKRAQAIYGKRADEAFKSLKAKADPPAKAPAARTVPARTTPGSARVSQAQRSSPGALTDPDAFDLVKESRKLLID